MTRDLDWGIPVPVEGAKGKVLYVWFDAPIGYISNTKELLPDTWETWWKDESTRLIHFIGKDNIVFHCIDANDHPVASQMKPISSDAAMMPTIRISQIPRCCFVGGKSHR